MDAPILLVTFNRPDITAIVLKTIKLEKPSKLYCFNDGPRVNNINDLEARNKIIKLIEEIDWECKVNKYFPEKNLGCGKGVSGAISWAFEKEEKLIILEDDCVPSLSFFKYCNYCLEKYKDDERIMHIAGNNYTENHNFTENDYFFSKYGHIWGWATWKRAWKYFDYNMTEWPQFRDSGLLKKVFEKKREVKYYEFIFNSYYNDYNKPWGNRWTFAKFKNGGISIVPKINLVKNIGSYGTHTKKEFRYEINVENNFEIKREPEVVSLNKHYDSYHFKYHIGRSRLIFPRIMRIVKKIIK